jgi:hypothetical protein
MADVIGNKGRSCFETGPLNKHKYSLFVLQILIKRIIELEEQIDLFLTYNILQLSLIKVKLDQYDKFELQSLAASVIYSSHFSFPSSQKMLAPSPDK